MVRNMGFPSTSLTASLLLSDFSNKVNVIFRVQVIWKFKGQQKECLKAEEFKKKQPPILRISATFYTDFSITKEREKRME